MNRGSTAALGVLVASVLATTAVRFRRGSSPREPALRSENEWPASSQVPAAAPSSEADGGTPSIPSALWVGPPPAGIDGSQGAPMFHGDNRHTHRAAARAPRSPPNVVWARDVGGPVEAQVTTSSDEQTLYVASLGGSLTALARSDGGERWRLALGDRVYTTPCVARDGSIYVGSDAKKFLSVSPDGKIKWSFETEGDADTAPVIANDGSIVFAAGRMVYDLTIYGQARWRFAAKRKVFTAPALGPGGRIFFGSQDHRAYGISDQGALLWSTDLGADVDGGPAVADDGSVFVGTDANEVVRLDPETGRVVWRSNVGGFVRGNLSITRSGDVLAGVYGPIPRQVRLRSDDGTLIGHFAIQGTGALEFGVHGGALEDRSGALLFGAQDDFVYAVGDGGALLWRFRTGADVDAPITLLSDGSVVVGSDDGRVYLLRAD